MISAIRSCVASAVVLNWNLLNLGESEIATRLWLLCGVWSHISPYHELLQPRIKRETPGKATNWVLHKLVCVKGRPAYLLFYFSVYLFFFFNGLNAVTFDNKPVIRDISAQVAPKCKFVPPNCKQTKLIKFFPLILSFYAILSPTGCLNLKQAWNPNPSRRLNSESSSPCKCCDNRGLRAISMLASASAIRQTRQQELGAGDIEEGLYLHFIQDDTSMCIRTRGINVPVLTSYTVNLWIFFLVYFVAMGTFVSKQAQSRETVGRKTHFTGISQVDPSKWQAVAWGTQWKDHLEE